MTTATKLVLGNLIPQEASPVNTYQLVVSFMHGDGDHHSEETFSYSLDQEEELIKAINFFNACLVAYPNGRGGNDTYEKLGLPDWEEWEDSIPHDITHDEDSATVEGIDVYFWNAKSEKFEVNLVNG